MDGWCHQSQVYVTAAQSGRTWSPRRQTYAQHFTAHPILVLVVLAHCLVCLFIRCVCVFAYGLYPLHLTVVVVLCRVVSTDATVSVEGPEGAKKEEELKKKMAERNANPVQVELDKMKQCRELTVKVCCWLLFARVVVSVMSRPSRVVLVVCVF